MFLKLIASTQHDSSGLKSCPTTITSESLKCIWRLHRGWNPRE